MERDGWLKVEVRHLAALRAVAQAGSFGAAATALGYTQSAISQQIATLERAVGETLIDRPGGPRRVALTEAGRVLLRHAERIVAGMEAAWADLAALSDGDSGAVRVGSYQSVGVRVLPQLMGGFLLARPGVQVELTESGNDAELMGLLERGEVDVSFTVLPLPEGPFEGVELLRDPYVLMVAAASPLAAQGFARVEDLEGRDLIGFRHCVAGERVDDWIRERGVDLRIVFRSDDNGTVQGLVGAGMADAVVPLLAVDRSDVRVAVLPFGSEVVPDRQIAIAWHRDRALSAAARAFIASAQRLCAEMAPIVAVPRAGGGGSG